VTFRLSRCDRLRSRFLTSFGKGGGGVDADCGVEED